MAIAYRIEAPQSAESLPAGLLQLYGRLSKEFGVPSVDAAPPIVWSLNEQVSLEVSVSTDAVEGAMEFVIRTVREIRDEYGELYSVMVVPTA